MIYTTLAIALIVRTYVLLAATLPIRRMRDDIDSVLHLLCLGCALAAMPLFHIDVRTALSAAFVADALVHLRELLDVLSDLCKTLVLTRQRHR